MSRGSVIVTLVAFLIVGITGFFVISENESVDLSKDEIVNIALIYYDTHQSLHTSYSRMNYQVTRLAYDTGYSISFLSIEKSGNIDEGMHIQINDNGTIHKTCINGIWHGVN